MEQFKSRDWHVSNVRRPHSETLVGVIDYPWTCRSEEKQTEQIDWQEEQPPQVVRVSANLKCWGTCDTNCGHKAKDITPSIAWRREAWKEEALDDLPWQDERGPSSVRWTLESFQRQRWGHFWETAWSGYGRFRAHRYHLEVKWTEMNWSVAKRCLVVEGENDSLSVCPCWPLAAGIVRGCLDDSSRRCGYRLLRASLWQQPGSVAHSRNRFPAPSSKPNKNWLGHCQGAFFIPAQLSSDAVGALGKMLVVIRLWKQHTVQART